MDDTNSCMIWFTTILFPLTITFVNAAYDVRVETSLVPSNQVEIGAVFAVHCQVWNLEEGQRVEIFKIADRRSYPLSVGLSVVQEVDERVLLAIRHISDGSVVYFLTVTDATIHDEAQYACKVIDTFPELAEVRSDTVNLRLMYFPSQSDPVCSESTLPYPAAIAEGETITMSCHSAQGNPTVSIAWVQGSDRYPNYTQTTRSGRVYATIKVQVKASEHHGAIFVCEITSDIFPGMKQTCHIGPLNVIRDPNSPPVLEESLTPSKPSEETQPDTGNVARDTNFDLKDCKDICGVNTNSPVIYWIITTMVTSVLAMIFFIVGVTLMVKLCRYSIDNETTYEYHEPARLQHEDAERIYREVEGRRRDDGSKMYMSLLKPYPADSDIIPQVTEKLQTRT